jgi:hypothetical protein
VNHSRFQLGVYTLGDIRQLLSQFAILLFQRVSVGRRFVNLAFHFGLQASALVIIVDILVRERRNYLFTTSLVGLL